MGHVESAHANQMVIIIQAGFHTAEWPIFVFLECAILESESPVESKIENLLKFNPVKDVKDSSDVQYWQKQNIFVGWEVTIAI